MQAGSSVHWVEQSHERERFLSHFGSRSHFIGSSWAAFWAALQDTTPMTPMTPTSVNTRDNIDAVNARFGHFSFGPFVGRREGELGLT
jgi:hypothetical protein